MFLVEDSGLGTGCVFLPFVNADDPATRKRHLIRQARYLSDYL
jgi:hypothetical protein